METLRELRKLKGITLKELGEAVGVAESTMSQYENGRRSPDFETLLKLAEYFDVSTDYLLGKADTKKAPILTQEDERDIEKQADEMLAGLGKGGLMLDGNPLSDEARELFRNAVIDGIRDAKLVNKLKHQKKDDNE